MAKKLLLLPTLILMYLLTACSSDKINIGGEITDKKFEGEMVYLYYMGSENMDVPVFAFKTPVKKGSFRFENIILKETDLPTIAFITTFDFLDQSMQVKDEEQLIATAVLEPGEIKIVLDGTAVLLSGTSKNEKLNKVHLAITNLVNFSKGLSTLEEIDTLPIDEKGRDGRAQFQELNTNLKDLTFDFTKENMSNNVGQFLFLRSYTDNMFTPAQILDLIEASTMEFQSKEEVKELKSILDQMGENFAFDDYFLEEEETEQTID